ncbi:phosphoribosyltransferase family protein [Halobium salinum]|uniref:Phosphoribosyltransferase family protein n=1 Tax=Halobium salinum TaxID=1364940 RepID=A0ABD5PGS7_9EURY|nr:phosphoribosyltransferase family protein [Halobium salinum]
MEFEAYRDRMGTDTVGRYDLTPLFADAETFESLRADLLAEVPTDPNSAPTVVAGIDALGFVLGSVLAADLDLGFVAVRKGGKLPYPEGELLRREFVDYSGESKALELHPRLLDADDRVLLVDEWVETGTQMRAAAALVEAAGASVSSIATVGIDHTEETESLFERYDVHHLG